MATVEDELCSVNGIGIVDAPIYAQRALNWCAKRRNTIVQFFPSMYRQNEARFRIRNKVNLRKRGMLTVEKGPCRVGACEDPNDVVSVSASLSKPT